MRRLTVGMARALRWGNWSAMPVQPARRLLRERLWTPSGRTPRQLRNARVKVLGSAILLAVLVVAAVGLLV